MWTKRYIRAGMLVAFAVLSAGCGAPIIAETTTGYVEQPVETTSAEAQESLVEGDAGPVQESPGSTVADGNMTASPSLEYSPAWIEWEELESLDNSDVLENIRIMYYYMSYNPNDNSTSMGALCWAFHELTRSSMMVLARWLLDDNLIPYLMEDYGVTSEQVGSPGPEATDTFLNMVSGELGSVVSVDDETGSQTVLPAENGNVGPVGSTGGADGISEDEYWKSVRLDHEFAGDGTAWSDAVRVVASPEMAAAFQAGEGLPPDVQVYADALVAFAEERVGKKLDPSAESDDLYFEEPSFPGLASFMEAAKYHQDCKRVAIVDIPGTVDSSSTTTTTTTTVPPVASTTTTQPTVEEALPSTTSTTAPPSATTTQPLEDDVIPSPTSTTAPVSATTIQPQVEDTSPSTTTTTLPVDDSVTTTTTQQPVEEPVATTLPQVEDTSPSTTTTVSVPPVDDSVATTTILPPGEGGAPTDGGGENGLFDGDGGGG